MSHRFDCLPVTLKGEVAQWLHAWWPNPLGYVNPECIEILFNQGSWEKISTFLVYFKKNRKQYPDLEVLLGVIETWKFVRLILKRLADIQGGLWKKEL